MKKASALLLTLMMVLSLAACSGGNPPANNDTPAPAEEGKVFNIHAWNEEFKGFFEKY